MRIVIFTGGKQTKNKQIKKLLENFPADYLIAADSGLDTVGKLGLNPNLIIGDFDSLKKTSLLDKYKDAKIKSFPQDKDFTDTELAMQAAEKIYKKASPQTKPEIFIFGAGGGKRIDHLIYFLRIFKGAFPPQLWVFNTGLAFCLSPEFKNHLEIKIPTETLISIFPVQSCKNKAPVKIFSAGLKWDISSLDWERQASISNRSLKPQVAFTVESGRFLIIANSHNLNW